MSDRGAPVSPVLPLDPGLPLRDPRTGEVDRELAAPTAAALDDVVASLRRHQPAWAGLGAEERAAELRALADLLADTREDLVAALEADTGRRIESEIEVDAVVGLIRRWSERAPDLLRAPDRTPTSLPWVTAEGTLHPYPLVGVISPWNFPLLLAMIDAVPALAAGCAVLVKPSEVTPRFAAPLRALLAERPRLAAVTAFVEGGAGTGRAIIDRVDAVAFTGSVETGRAVAMAAATRLVPAFLELGGKDAAIVLADADLERAATAILWGGTSNTGQSCLSIERVYVEEPVADTFIDHLVAAAARVRVGPGGLGPFIDARQADVVRRHLDDALTRGAVLRTGGHIGERDGGQWCDATVLTDVDHSMLVMTEETFGPVLPVMVAADEADAVRLANDTAYGLSAAVFAGTQERALAVAARLRAGAVSINDAGLGAFVHEREKDSFGVSGLGGSRMGTAGLLRFLRRQAFLISDATTPDPWWWDTSGPDGATDQPGSPAGRPPR